MKFDVSEILETIKMNSLENLDVRTVTLGLSLFDCSSGSIMSSAEKIREKILRHGSPLVPTADRIASVITSYSIHYTKLYDIPVSNW